jgi:hypothetical protein
MTTPVPTVDLGNRLIVSVVRHDGVRRSTVESMNAMPATSPTSN